MKPRNPKISLSTGELDGLRRRVRHRLDKRIDMLSRQEFSYLLQMEEQLGRAISLTANQLDWLLDILERTKSKWGR